MSIRRSEFCFSASRSLSSVPTGSDEDNQNHAAHDPIPLSEIPIYWSLRLHYCTCATAVIASVTRVTRVRSISRGLVHGIFCRIRNVHPDWLAQLTMYLSQSAYSHPCLLIPPPRRLGAGSHWDNTVLLWSCILYFLSIWQDRVTSTLEHSSQSVW